jgi:hypothetical protein
MSCFTPVRGKMMRLTRVDGCGRPICGPCSTVVSKGITTAEFSPQVEEGEAISVPNFTGEICVDEPACPTMSGIEVTVTFCRVDTDAFSFITGEDPVVNDSGEGVGFDFGDIPCAGGFALEIWTGVASAGGCGAGNAAAEYGYFVLPWITSARLGDWTVENSNVTFSITGTARRGSGWGKGPYDVQDYASGVPGPLFQPIAPHKFGRLIRTTVAPPEEQCGCQELTGCDDTVESIQVDPAAATVPIGLTEQLTVFGVESDGGVQDLTDVATFVSSDPAVATVDANGLVTAVAAGTATITASTTTPGPFNAISTITVD